MDQVGKERPPGRRSVSCLKDCAKHHRRPADGVDGSKPKRRPSGRDGIVQAIVKRKYRARS